MKWQADETNELMKQLVDETTGWWNNQLMKEQIDVKWVDEKQIVKTSKLLKQQILEMTSWQNNELMKQQVEKSISWWNEKLMKLQEDEVTNY